VSTRNSQERSRLRRHAEAPVFPRTFLRALALGLAILMAAPPVAVAADVLVLQRTVSVRQRPHISSREVGTIRAGEVYEVATRPSGKQPRYILDDEGYLWMRIRVSDELSAFVQTDQVSVAREEFLSPRGTPLLLVNIRATADGDTDRDLWLIQDNWRRTIRLARIEGRPAWAASGEWLLCQVESRQLVRDTTMERTVERIERFTADGRTRTFLAAGSQFLLDPTRNEIFFYRDVDDQGDLVPPGLFAVSPDGGPLRLVFSLPERYRFWKEDGDYYVQAPAPVLQQVPARLALFAYERNGTLARYTVTPDGHLVEIRRE
jgi:hypothetical protein